MWKCWRARNGGGDKDSTTIQRNVYKFMDISMKRFTKVIKVITDITSEKFSIDWTNYVQEIVILLAMTSWRQWPKNTWQGKTNPLNLRPSFSKCPHVGYQISSFFTRIWMKLLNFKNILKNYFRLTVKKRQAHKNVVTYQCDQSVAENFFLFF